jgi:hypothetical protein
MPLCSALLSRTSYRRVRHYVDPEFEKRAARGESVQAALVEESTLKVYTKGGRVLSERQ